MYREHNHKKIKTMNTITRLASVALLTCALSLSTAFAQAPEKMSYQAVIRNASNALVTSQGVGIQVSILKGGASGTAVFVETHNATTNINGLVTLEIGTGTLVSGDFTTIDWGADTYFIQTETDPTTAGGTNYTITGTTQLMSVPYALHAKTAESVTGTVNYTETDPTFTAWDKSSGIVITESQISDLTHIVDTDTQLDSAGIANYGYVAGNHTVDTDTHIDSVGIVALGFNAGGIVTETDPTFTAWDKSTGIVITESQISDLTHTVDTDTHIDSIGIANLGYVAGITQVTAGTNVTVTGAGTTASPYVVNAGGGATLAIGDSYQGGIIFWLDATGQHGLIAATTDQSTGIQWYAGTYGVTRARGDGLYAGKVNTAIIIAAQVAIGDDGNNYAAQICSDYSVTDGGVTYGDWYLPSKYELNLLYLQKSVVGGFASAYYWSSSELYDLFAWHQYFGSGGQVTNTLKDDTHAVRAVRAF